MDEAQHYINKEEATWDGKIWSAAWYLQPSYPIVYNKEAFTAAGLDPETPPATWDEFLAACDAFAAHDMPLIGLGVKDTWGTGRFWMDSLVQQVEGVGQVLQAVTGETSFTDPPVCQLLRPLAGDGPPRLLPRRRGLARHVHRPATRAAGQGRAHLHHRLRAGLLRRGIGEENTGVYEDAGHRRRSVQGPARLDLADAGGDLVGERRPESHGRRFHHVPAHAGTTGRLLRGDRRAPVRRPLRPGADRGPAGAAALRLGHARTRRRSSRTTSRSTSGSTASTPPRCR